MSGLRTFIKKLPKAELHLHIEGSLEPELLFKLAQRNNVKLRFKTVEEIREAYNFHNLQSFLDIYYEGAGVLIQEQDFYDLTWQYLERCRADKVLHTEIFFDPQTHTDRGISFDTVINGISKALEDGQKKFGITTKIIMCFLRHLSMEEGFRTLEMALPHKAKIIGVGLDSSEVGNPPKKFEKLFEACRKEGFLTVAHAGEEGPTKNIWEALDLLQVKRVDHGVRSLEDESLVQRLVKEKIALTVCPLSNIKLCVFSNMKEHNLKKLMDKGLKVTINSDDPAYFGGYMNQNFIETAEALALSKEDLANISKNAFEAAFLSTPEKEAYIAKVDALL